MDDRIQDIYKKIEREKALINAANLMRQQTNNDAVRSKLDTQMREGRRNLEFFEGTLREMQMRSMGQGMDNLSIGGSTLAASASSSSRPRSAVEEDGPMPPPKDGGYGAGGDGYGQTQYSQIGEHGDLMPPRGPFANQGPGSHIPKTRPNFTKLGESTGCNN